MDVRQHGNAGCGHEPAQIPAGSGRRLASRFANLAQDIAGEERRGGRFGRTTEQIPKLFVFFAFHGGDLTPFRRESCLRLRCFEETFELPDAGRVPHLAKRLK